MGFKNPPSQEQKITPEQIKAIEDMPVEPWEKVELLLVKLGIKKATDFDLVSAGWSESLGEPKDEIDFNQLKMIEKSLDKLGLVYEIMPTKVENFKLYNTYKLAEDITEEDGESYKWKKKQIRLAGDKENLLRLNKAINKGDDEALGELYAFPETAIEAYKKTEEGDNCLLSFEELPEDVRNQEWINFLTFRLSKDNWKNEIETVKKWARVVKEKSPKIYKEYLDFKRFDFEGWLKEEILLPESDRSEKFKEYINEKDYELRSYQEKEHSYNENEKVKEIFGRYVQDLNLDLEQLRGKKILDLGCGGGEFVVECIKRGITKDIYGFDLELEGLALNEKYKHHFRTANFNDDFPFNNCDYIISYGAVFLDDKENWIKILNNALKSLKDEGEIRIFPIKKAGPDSDLEGIKKEEEVTKRVLSGLENDWAMEWELKPIDIKVAGYDKDVWLEQVLIVRKKGER
ncbi:MAG: methyltransferase domain-containing protein [Candidatus Moranbacteria bacterium]|nr:methyltransferase domain-containing protein [Candidatus Moranbacteria bacterium]